MKRVLLAFDSFKGSLTALEAGEAAAEGVANSGSLWESEILAISDGGEGMMDAMTTALGGEYICASVSGPIGEPVIAKYGVFEDTAIIEVSQACGLTLVAEADRNPEKTTTFGVGQLVTDALNQGCRKFKIGLGGSATNDAGVGMLRALGYRFYDSSGKEIGYCGGEVGQIERIEDTLIDNRLKECNFIIGCDVSNALCGPNGASFVFGGQKGADFNMQQRLDCGLKSYSKIASAFIGKDYSSCRGAGAAGGLGFALLGFLNASTVRGVDMVLDAIDFDSRLKNVDLIITGEGRLDSQTLMGKAPCGILKRAREAGVPVIALGGSLEAEVVPKLIEAGFKAVLSIVPESMPVEEAMRKEVAKKNMEIAITRLFRTI